jgi:hypothetical protein
VSRSSYDVLPAAALDRPQQRRLDAHPGQRLLEARCVLAVLGDRAAELVVPITTRSSKPMPFAEPGTKFPW